MNLSSKFSWNFHESWQHVELADQLCKLVHHFFHQPISTCDTADTLLLMKWHHSFENLLTFSWNEFWSSQKESKQKSIKKNTRRKQAAKFRDSSFYSWVRTQKHRWLLWFIATVWRLLGLFLGFEVLMKWKIWFWIEK